MRHIRRFGWSPIGLSILVLLVAACGPTATPVSAPTSALTMQQKPDIPVLPFPDNPDPAQCGIPVPWGKDNPAWLDGRYQGELVQPTVFLYDSHLRGSITGAAPSGTSVRIVLYQQNPTLDYYLVETVDLDPPQEGWVPAPFLRFDPPQ